MSTKTPKAKYGRAGETGHSDQPGKNQQQPASPQEKSRSFDQGLSNNSNTQTGTAQSGYDEKNPKKPAGKQQQEPKVTNQENKITNSQEQDELTEEPVEEKATGNSNHQADPEIDAPLPEQEPTEHKIPTMKGE